MLKAGLTALVALFIGSSVALADRSDRNFGHAPAVRAEAMLSSSQVARLKVVLKLTAAQEQLWAPVEQAFRELRQMQEAAGSQGFVQSIKHRAAAAIGLDSMALRRLASAAYPLLRSLNEEQKQSGLAFVRSAGLEAVAAAF
jgi:hypothetical protein